MRITVDCSHREVASILSERRLRPPKSHVDCALPPIAPDASIRVSFWKKNRAQSSVLLLQITADCARRTYGRTDGHFFNFDNYIYRLAVLYSYGTQPCPFPPTTTEFRETASQFLASPCLRLRLGQTCVALYNFF